MFNRLASLIVASGYVVAAYLIAGFRGNLFVHCLIAVVIAVPVIWFADVFSDYTGPANWGFVARPTPGIMIAIAGWLILLVVPLVFIVIR